MAAVREPTAKIQVPFDASYDVHRYHGFEERQRRLSQQGLQGQGQLDNWLFAPAPTPAQEGQGHNPTHS
ncbi:uncharacterized protein PSFLO_01831 [Pseudozyma flocculosa]|uniref:Uncharacterized protein n=1 Tax=Pseudozyma flocculosa TaxID=84751 RepID=A0A5C3EWW9_9BASI|nr:uncharacterized protein PSFLO_01831 [Pseudozyma flocculosa]